MANLRKERKCPCMRIKEKKIKGKDERETDIEGLQAITPSNLAIIWRKWNLRSQSTSLKLRISNSFFFSQTRKVLTFGMVQQQGNLLSYEEKHDTSKKSKSQSFTIPSMGGVWIYITAGCMKQYFTKSKKKKKSKSQKTKPEPEKFLANL